MTSAWRWDRNPSIIPWEVKGTSHQIISFYLADSERLISAAIRSPRRARMLVAGWDILNLCASYVMVNPNSRAAQWHKRFLALTLVGCLPGWKISFGFIENISPARSINSSSAWQNNSITQINLIINLYSYGMSLFSHWAWPQKPWTWWVTGADQSAAGWTDNRKKRRNGGGSLEENQVVLRGNLRQ